MRVACHRVVAVTVAVSAVIAGCSSDGKKTEASTTQTSAAPTSPIDLWNTQRAEQGFDDAANQQALDVLRGLADAGVACTDLQIEEFGALVTSYQEVSLPLPLGSASCTGPAGENVLIEVFPTQQIPTAADFVARKGELVCAKGRELGEQPDGSNDFEGLPYVEDRTAGWIIEPDSFGASREIADALDLADADMCAEASALR